MKQTRALLASNLLGITFKEEKVYGLDNKYKVAEFIENTLNERLTEVEEMVSESETIALVAELKGQIDFLQSKNKELTAELETKTQKLENIAELVNE